ncbi:MAG: hypothetical protein ACPGED_04260 [Flavobacteriales bacterium]
MKRQNKISSQYVLENLRVGRAIYMLLPLLLGLFACYNQFKTNLTDEEWPRVIKVDGKGYYAYLPAIFVHNDLNFSWFQEVEVENAIDPNLIYWYTYNFEGNTVNKYFVGEAVLLTPFFLVAHFWCWISNSPMTGFSFPYIFMLSVAALFYFILGAFFIKKSLEKFGASRLAVCVSLLAVCLGTNLYYYTIREYSMSHVYSFAMVALFVYLIISFFQNHKTSTLITAAACLGLIVLIRPVNGLVVLAIPFLAGTYTQLKTGVNWFFSKPLIALCSALVTGLVLCIQLIIYKIQTGSWWVYSYAEEGFNFDHPEIFNFLLSYKKGLFVYTPVTALALIGFVALFWKKKWYRSITLFAFLALVVFVLSSWWMWFYGGSFSCRPMIEYYPFFAFLFAFAIDGMKRWYLQLSLIIALVFCVWLNQGQTWQYVMGSMHWDSMDKEFYWRIFPLLF